ncbi:MAG: hypothetical protein QXS85_04365 [Acidilobaceae archaeon]
MDRRVLLAGVAALLAVLVIANAAAFAYRWLAGTIQIAPATQATGAACTGFYSSAAQPGIPLPPAGTNYDATTYGDNKITVTPGFPVCEFTYGGTTYKLYESITVTIPVTVGSWYIRDLYGFGYAQGTGTVYVFLKVEDTAEHPVTMARLIVYKGTDKIGELDLTQLGAVLSFELRPGEGVQLDLYFKAEAQGTVSFKVGFYVSHENEPPR